MKKELKLLNITTEPQKIINFYMIYGVELEYIKSVSSFAVIRYYYKIKNNAKISKINNLINELQLFIECQKIKLDFEQLNGCIIFECSKQNRNILYFEDLKNDKKEGLTASIGKDLNNKEIELNLLETPHLLIRRKYGKRKKLYFKQYYKFTCVEI